jgi:2-dehydropantoate 2-reductase
MNIVVFGAGAIGSLFGGLLSKENNVVLIGRKTHVEAIQKNGLKIIGKTNATIKVPAEYNIRKIPFSPDLILLTVKSFDSEAAIKESRPLITAHTLVLSFQNGLGNIDLLKNYVKHTNILAGVTTHGARLVEPGIIDHTGIGWTSIGELNGKSTVRLKTIVSIWRNAGFSVESSRNISTVLWSKAVINSSINTLTAYFRCKNGYLLENPFLEGLLERICYESTAAANAQNINLSYKQMVQQTKQVVQDTANNYSSMLQSIMRGGKTEIDSINGYLVDIGTIYKIPMMVNELLLRLLGGKK